MYFALLFVCAYIYRYGVMRPFRSSSPSAQPVEGWSRWLHTTSSTITLTGKTCTTQKNKPFLITGADRGGPIILSWQEKKVLGREEEQEKKSSPKNAPFLNVITFCWGGGGGTTTYKHIHQYIYTYQGQLCLPGALLPPSPIRQCINKF